MQSALNDQSRLDHCNLKMHLHRIEAHRIALIVVIITCGVSWASKQCKTIVMDVHMKKCRLGARAKRGLEKFDLQKYDEKYESKRQEPDHHPEMNDSASHGVPQKRQLSSGLVAGDIVLPIVAKAINAGGAHLVSGTGYYGPGPSLLNPIFDRSGYYSPSPYPLSRRVVTPFHVPVSQSFSKSIPFFGRWNPVNPSRLIRPITRLRKYLL